MCAQAKVSAPCAIWSTQQLLLNNHTTVLLLQEFGYFNRPSPPIRRLPQPINFNRLLSQAEYRYEMARAYKQLQVGRHEICLLC